MNTDSHVEHLGTWILCVLLFVSDCAYHLTSNLNNVVCFTDLNLLVSTFFRDLAVKAHYNVAVAYGVNLVATNAVTDLIESAKQARKKGNYFLWRVIF